MPAAKACKAYKFARTVYRPYCIVAQSETGVVIHPVGRPQADAIRVAYNRIQYCAESIPDVFWPTRARVTQTRSRDYCRRSHDTDTQTPDVVSGSESIPSRPGMNNTKQQLWRSDLKESQVDPPES